MKKTIQLNLKILGANRTSYYRKIPEEGDRKKPHKAKEIDNFYREPGASHMYSNDLILVSNRKEITKKYIFHMFGVTLFVRSYPFFCPVL